MFDFFISSIIIITAAGVQVVTGFGFALIAIPLLLYIYPSYEAVFICMVLSLVTLLLQGRKNRKVARWDLIWRLVAIGSPGVLIGILISGALNASFLKGIVGVTVLGYVFLQLMQSRQKNVPTLKTDLIDDSTIHSESNELETLPAQEKKLPRGFYSAGFLSGILTGAAGLPGPPVAAVLILMLPKDLFRATIVNYFIITYSLALILALGLSQQSLSIELMTTILTLLLPILIGYFLGYHLQKYVDEQNFKRLVYALLIIIGITSIGQIFATIYY